MGSSLKIIFHHLFFLRLVFSVYCCYVFLFFFEIFSDCSLLYIIRNLKIITGRRRCVLTEESPRLTKMDDNNSLPCLQGITKAIDFEVPIGPGAPCRGFL